MLMKISNKADVELTLVALPGISYTIHWNYYLYEIILANNFEQFFFFGLKEKSYPFSLAKLWLSVSIASDIINKHSGDATRWRREVNPPCPFLKNKKNYLILEKKCPE